MTLKLIRPDPAWLPKATPRPYFTTASGQQIDLVNPVSQDISFADAAHHLSLMTRYGGAVRRFYPVAEHLLRGIRLASPKAKPYWLAHDLHEYFFQDDTTPKKEALALALEEELRELFPLGDIQKMQLALARAGRAFEHRAMCAVHLAAGLHWPVPIEINVEVKHIDRVMLVTEWKYLMPGEIPEAYRWPDVQPIEEDFGAEPWPYLQYRNDFYSACRWLLPAIRV